MKNVIALSLLCFSSAALADKACWDGTFGYNYVRAVETAEGLEISLQGSTLELPPLYANSGSGYLFGDFSPSRPELHIVLPKSAVKNENGTITAAFSGTIADTFDDQSRSLWIEHGVQDLDAWRPVITSVPLLSFKAKISDEAVAIDFTQLWAYDKQGKNLKSSLNISCMHNFVPDELRVPDRLKEHLSSRK